LLRERGRSPNETAEQFSKLLDAEKQRQQALEDEVKKRENSFEVARAGKKTAKEQARLAREKGLHGKAVELLIGAEEEVNNDPGLFFELVGLLLQMGRVREPHAWIKPEYRKAKANWVQVPPLHVFHPADWYGFLLAAALGDYKEADERLRAMAEEQD